MCDDLPACLASFALRLHLLCKTQAKEEASPISDMRGPAEFRRHLVGVLVKRTLSGAVDRAKGKFVANAVQEEAA